ncbi:hypothetical protein [Streptomyces qinzhouensis]|uniref:Uncharacterized protein n=1 Tax=Streptomyces qinzhouensis TaxID=2599401 RepID=A0A5B8J5I9_9ACTN|nr:hypothetical protein [Streptomyces qinzhouensis]QDY75301.1 hypothetical protein FQU76_00960 [Streptomyces qinzhouensis]
MNAVNAVLQFRRRMRRADRPAAAAVAIGNLLLLAALAAIAVGLVPGFEPDTRERESAAQKQAGRVFGYWLAGGLLVFASLGMTRALFTHVTTMLAPPAALILILASRM